MKNIKMLTIILFILIEKDQAVILRCFATQELVNNNIDGSQSTGGIYKLSNDCFVIVWLDSPTQNYYMQIYNEVGEKQGTNIYIISNCSGNKNFIADLGNNKFAFACFKDTYAQLIVYDYNGSAILGPMKASSSTTWLENICIAKLDDGSLVLSWSSTLTDIYYSIVTQSGMILVEGRIPQPQGYNRHSLQVESFQNNRFITCWREIGPGADYIYCQVMNSLGVTSIQQFQIDTLPTGLIAGYNGISLKRTSDNNILIVYHKVSGVYITSFLSAYNSNGIVIYGPIELNSNILTTKLRPRTGILSNGHFVITYNTGNQIFLQELDTNFQEIGNRIIVDSKDNLTNDVPDVTGLNRTGYAVVFMTNNMASPTSSNDVYLQIYYGDEDNLTCKDIVVYIKTTYPYSLTYDFLNNISYQYMADMKAMLLENPKSGNFQLDNGTTITANTAISISSYYYKSPDIQDSFTIDYIAINHWASQSSICKLNINVCYPTCETCISVGSDVNHSCTSCKGGYFSLQSFCYSTCPQQKDGIYYYTSITKSCNQCVFPCNACTAAISCTSCSTGYYLVENLTSNNCVQACPSGYYLIGTICKQCNSLCFLCIDDPDNCPKCIQSAYYLSLNKCVSVCPFGYVPNESGECVTCKSLNKYFYIDRCVDSCPKGIEDSINKLCNDAEISIPCNSFITSAVSCSQDSCNRQGQCDIQFNQLYCTCNPGYVGAICQYPSESFIVKEFVSNKILIKDNQVSTIQTLNSDKDIQTLNDLYSLVKNTNITESVGDTDLQSVSDKVYSLICNILSYIAEENKLIISGIKVPTPEQINLNNLALNLKV
jgi:hypothetical protein